MSSLKRQLSLFDVTIYGIGIILGAGIYALIGEAAALTGQSLWLSFVIGAVIAAFTGLSYAELATTFPQAAAEYIYIKKGFNSRLLAFLIGWLMIFTGVTTVATVALGFAGYLNGLFSIPKMLAAIVLIMVMSYFNYAGIKKSSRINVIFTLIEVFGLILVILLAFFDFESIQKVNFLEMANGSRGLLSAAGLVFFAYIGFEDIANVAEEAKNPQKILSKAFILAVVITTILYVLTSIAAVSLASPEELGKSESPLALAVSKTFLGQNAFNILSAVALFATANTVLVGLIVGSRMMYGMARDKSLPVALSAINKNTGTPWVTVIVMLIFSIAFLFFGEIDFIANISSLGAFLTFALVNASLILIRYKFPDIKRHFRTPLNIGNFPIISALGLISSSVMIFQFEYKVIFLTTVIILSGLIYYKTFRFNQK